MTSRPSAAAPILVVLAIVLVTLGSYVGAYFWLGEYRSSAFYYGIERKYPQQWLSTCFVPAGWLEAKLGRYPVGVTGPDDEGIGFSP